MLQFTEISSLIEAQKTASKQGIFAEYTSKKALLADEKLPKEMREYMAEIKNLFAYSVHPNNKYLVVSRYFSKTKKIDFMVLNLATKQYAPVASVKAGKLEVLELVKAELAAAEAAAATETVEVKPETVEEVATETAEKAINKPISKPTRNAK